MPSTSAAGGPTRHHVISFAPPPLLGLPLPGSTAPSYRLRIQPATPSRSASWRLAEPHPLHQARDDGAVANLARDRTVVPRMTVERTDPPFLSPERDALREWLEFQRATLHLKCDGLDRAGLVAQPVPTSVLSLHGLVRHMAEVERNWFGASSAARTPNRSTTTTSIPTATSSSSTTPTGAPTSPPGRRSAPSSGARSGCALARHHGHPSRRAGVAALDHAPHDRGVRPPQRSRRPDPRDGRRHDQRLDKAHAWSAASRSDQTATSGHVPSHALRSRS